MGNIFSRYPPKHTWIVEAGKSSQVTITKAARASAASGEMQEVYIVEGAVIDYTWPIPEGVRIIQLSGRPAEQDPPRPRMPYQTHLVCLILARACAEYFDVPTGAPYGAGISAARYLMDKGIPVTHGIMGGMIGYTGAGYGDIVPPLMTVNQLRYALWMKGDKLISATKTAAYGDLRNPEAFWDEVLNDRARIESLYADFGAAPTGFTAFSNSTSSAVLKQLGARCMGYTEGGGENEPIPGKSYGQIAVHRDGWYARGILDTFSYGWVHGSEWPNGHTAYMDPLHMYRSFNYEEEEGEGGSPSTFEEGGRSMFCTERITNGRTHAQFRTIIDRWVALRDAGIIDFVTYDTLFRGMREPGPSATIVGEVLVVASDVGTLRQRPKQILGIHGTVGVTSTVFTVVPAGRTLVEAGVTGLGECHVDYLTGVITFHADDNPTDVTVDYNPVPAWGGLRQWNFADMADGALPDTPTNANAPHKYGWYAVTGAGAPSILDHELVITGSTKAAYVDPGIAGGESFMLRVKARGTGSGALQIRAFYRCVNMATGSPVDEAIEATPTPRVLGASDAYYYWAFTIPKYIHRFSLRFRCDSGTSVTIKSVEWAVC